MIEFRGSGFWSQFSEACISFAVAKLLDSKSLREERDHLVIGLALRQLCRRPSRSKISVHDVSIQGLFM